MGKVKLTKEPKNLFLRSKPKVKGVKGDVTVGTKRIVINKG